MWALGDDGVPAGQLRNATASGRRTTTAFTVSADRIFHICLVDTYKRSSAVVEYSSLPASQKGPQVNYGQLPPDQKPNGV